MKRGGKLVAACAAVLMALAGCGSTPAGVDKNLLDDWPALAQAITPEPATGTCYSTEYSESWSGDFDSRSVNCAEAHWTETTFVGKFTGTVAGREVPPLTASAELAEAFKSCTEKTKEFLGGDWQRAFVQLALTVPGKPAWKGGARWYRCELSGLSKDLNEDFVKLTGSAKGTLSSKGPLARGCSLLQADSSNSIKSDEAVDCAKPHNAEFAGLYTVNASSYPSRDQLREKAISGCQQVFTSFLGIAPSKSHYFGYTWHTISEEEWNLGVRTSICSVLGFSGSSPNGVRFTGSVKGIGDRKPTGWK
jgi:hypothetical protein